MNLSYFLEIFNRTIYGNGGKNTVYGSDSETSVKKDYALVFNKKDMNQV